MTETRREGSTVYFNFKCPGCDAEGELGIDISKTILFGCPEGCGSTFVPWRPRGKQWQLRCVVQPVGGAVR